MIGQNKSQSGFIGGAFVASLVASVAMLGTLIALTAGMAQKVGVTQQGVNSISAADKLAKYILNNKIQNIDDDEYLELPRIQENMEGEDQDDNENNGNWSEELNSGFIEPLNVTVNGSTVDLRNTLGKDAFGNYFKFCSVNIQTNTMPLANTGRREVFKANIPIAIRQIVFVIISGGEDGIVQTTDCTATITLGTPASGSDDRVKLIRYGDVLEQKYGRRLELLSDEIPNCAADKSLEYIPDANGGFTWSCTDKYMGFVKQLTDLYNPGTGRHNFDACSPAQRLSLDDQGRLTCRSIDALANQIPEDVNMSRLAAGLCRRGYYVDGLSISSGKYNFNCHRMASYGAEIGDVTETSSMTENAASCAISVNGDQFKARFRGRDGIVRCIAMPRSIISSGDCAAKPLIFYDRGLMLCFNAGGSGMSSVQHCQANEVLQFQTITNQVRCIALQTEERRDWIIPYSSTRPSCHNTDYVMNDGTNYVCMTREELLGYVAPTAVCSNYQMIAWDEASKKMKCIQR